VRRSVVFLLMLAPAVAGTLAHYPAYKLGGYLATRISRDSDDVISTVKIISAMLLFPLTWIVLAVLGYLYFGWMVAVLALIVIPFSGYVAIVFFEELDKSIAGVRVLMFFLVRRRFFVRLLAERNAIRDEIIALGKETPIASD
jgi:hypothetical protein